MNHLEFNIGWLSIYKDNINKCGEYKLKLMTHSNLTSHSIKKQNVSLVQGMDVEENKNDVWPYLWLISSRHFDFCR